MPAAFNSEQASRWRKVVGENVRRARERKDISQAGLAKRAGVSRANLRKIEDGKGNPSVGMLADLADVMGMEPGDFFRKSPGFDD